MEDSQELQTMRTYCINSAEDAEPAFHIELGGPPTSPQADSRRRGPAETQRQYCPTRSAVTHLIGGEGEDSASEFSGNGGGRAAQALHHVNGDGQVILDIVPLQAADLMGQPMEPVANRQVVAVLSPSRGSINGGGATGYFVAMGSANTTGESRASRSAHKYAKVLLALFGISLSACAAAYPVIKQAAAAPDEYTTLAYGLSVVLAFILLAGLLATSFDESPRSLVCGKYALQLALGLTIGLLTWSICSLSPAHKFDVPIGIAGAVAYGVVVVLFHWRKW